MAEYYVDGSGDAIPVMVNLEAYKGVPPVAPIGVQSLLAANWIDAAPISLDSVKTYLRVETTDEDALIESFLDAAVSYCQDISNTIVVSTSILVYYSDFPPSGVPIAVPVGSALYARTPTPTIQYTDISGATVTLNDITDFTSYKQGANFIIIPQSGEWPTDYDRTGPRGVQVSWSVQGDSTNLGQRQFWIAVQMLVGHWYATRDAVVCGSAGEVPFGVNALLQNSTFYGGLS